MKKLKFYALCTRNMNALKRHQTVIPKEDLHIVINTLDQYFETSAVNYCRDEEIQHTVTSSDGTASTGKNSFLELFKNSNNDFAVLIDGDDFLTPHGVWTYKQLAQSEGAPDIMALEYQYCIFKDCGYNTKADLELNKLFENPYTGCADKFNPETVQGWGTRGFYKNRNWWKKSLDGSQVPVIPGEEFSQDLHDTHKKWADHCYKYINNWETHCRIVWFSKKTTSLDIRFDPEYVVGEDTVIYFEYKHLHMQNELVMKHLFDRWPTYVYDMRVDGVVEFNKHAEGTLDKGWYNWLKKLTNKYDELEAEGKMHDDKLPYVTVCTDPYAPDADTSSDIIWEVDYKPDVCNFVAFPGKERIIFH